jgi:L-arabinose isomerase
MTNTHKPLPPLSIQRGKLILNLSPGAAIDYAAFNRMGDRTAMTGEWLAYCSACPVPEIANVFSRAGIDFHQVTGILQEDPLCWNEVGAWIEAARVAHTMFHNRLGLMLQCATFGGHIEILEVNELAGLRREVSAKQIKDRVAHFRKVFDVQPDCVEPELQRAARTSVALDRLVTEHELGSLAYFFLQRHGERRERRYDQLNHPRQFVADGARHSSRRRIRSEERPGDEDHGHVRRRRLVHGVLRHGFRRRRGADGHDGPGHIAIAQGKTKVRPLKVYHGKVGRGLSVQMSVKHGPITCLSVVEAKDGRLKLLVDEGESVRGPILEIGNTNSRYRFSLGARKFVNEWNSHGPAHHCAIGVGNISEKIEKLGKLLGIEAIRVC